MFPGLEALNEERDRVVAHEKNAAEGGVTDEPSHGRHSDAVGGKRVGQQVEPPPQRQSSRELFLLFARGRIGSIVSGGASAISDPTPDVLVSLLARFPEVD